MATFRVDTRDAKFVLFEQIGAEKFTEMPKFAEADKETMEQILEEGANFAVDKLAPLNRLGDEHGCTLENGQVKFPEGFNEVYKEFCENSWNALSAPEEYGGMGLPFGLSVPVMEFGMGACLSFTFTPGLTTGVAGLLEHFGSDELKETYLEKLVTGEWAGTMCLTEPGAGSAVGDLTTTAVPQGDGTYKITGTKMFITSGDHDATDNIVHAVLARVKGAPSGIKGVSLFIIPKNRVDGTSNDVTVGNIEHKMGINASATCTLNFGENDNCIGVLLGEENNGIKYMFKLMNEARIFVGIQGLAQAARAYQHSLEYAQERVQGTRIEDFKDVNAPRVAIIEHPDVRRMLMYQKAVVEGMRSMVYYGGLLYDQALHHPDQETRDNAQMVLDLLTPVIKAYCSDTGFKSTDQAIMIHGGYGYVKEYEVEQCLRDVKIACIYEGTNGIQSLDLVGRKLSMKGGMLFMTWMMKLQEFAEKHAKHPVLGKLVAKFEDAKNTMAEVTMGLGGKAMEGDLAASTLFATPFMEMFGEVALAYFLLDGAVIAQDKLNAIFEEAGASDPDAQKKVIEDNAEAKFYAGRVKSAEFFVHNVLPGVHTKAAVWNAGDRSALEVVF